MNKDRALVELAVAIGIFEQSHGSARRVLGIGISPHLDDVKPAVRVVTRADGIDHQRFGRHRIEVEPGVNFERPSGLFGRQRLDTGEFLRQIVISIRTPREREAAPEQTSDEAEQEPTPRTRDRGGVGFSALLKSFSLRVRSDHHASKKPRMCGRDRSRLNDTSTGDCRMESGSSQVANGKPSRIAGGIKTVGQVFTCLFTRISLSYRDAAEQRESLAAQLRHEKGRLAHDLGILSPCRNRRLGLALVLVRHRLDNPIGASRRESEANRLPRENLLLFHGPKNERFPVRTTDDWLKRRGEIVQGMSTVMGPLPGPEKRCALDLKIEEEVNSGSYVRRFVTYASEPGCRVPAYLLIPKAVLKGNGKRAGAILALHPTDDKVGHGVVVGLGGTRYPPYANELAERGYVVLAPNYPWLAKYRPDLKALGWESGTLKAVWDNIRGLDLLDSLPFVKHGTYGAIGHSLGGHNAVFTAVFDDRIQVVVSSCGLDSFSDYYDANEAVWQPGKGWTQSRYMPKLADYRGRLAEIPFDFHELIGALAPRSVLLIAPLKDDNFRAASVDRIAEAARPVYRLYRRENRLRVEHPDWRHDFPKEMRELAYEQFDAEIQ